MSNSFLFKVLGITVSLVVLIVCSMYIGNLITKTYFIEHGERIAVKVNEVSEDVVLSSLNNLDTVYVVFDEDVVTFVPDGNNVGYVVYSDVAAENYDDHAIDYLWQEEATAFIHHTIQSPLCGDDREKANEYYRELINDKVYWGGLEPAQNNN